MDKVKTGELIRAARKAKNCTQSELADMLGVTNKAVSRWEKGQSFPDIGVLENLAHILDLKIQDIVVGEVQTSEADIDSGEITVAEIVRMATVQIQRKGIGTGLVLESIDWAKESGYSKLILETVARYVKTFKTYYSCFCRAFPRPKHTLHRIPY